MIIMTNSMEEFTLITIGMSLITAVFCYLSVKVIDLIDFWIDRRNDKKDQELMDDFKRI